MKKFMSFVVGVCILPWGISGCSNETTLERLQAEHAKTGIIVAGDDIEHSSAAYEVLSVGSDVYAIGTVSSKRIDEEATKEDSNIIDYIYVIEASEVDNDNFPILYITGSSQEFNEGDKVVAIGQVSEILEEGIVLLWGNVWSYDYAFGNNEIVVEETTKSNNSLNCLVGEDIVTTSGATYSMIPFDKLNRDGTLVNTNIYVVGTIDSKEIVDGASEEVVYKYRVVAGDVVDNIFGAAEPVCYVAYSHNEFELDEKVIALGTFVEVYGSDIILENTDVWSYGYMFSE